MRFLMDPASVAIGPAGWLFLVVVCIGLPLGALRQHRRLNAGTLALSRAQIYQSAVATHAMFLLLCWVVIRGARLRLFPTYQVTAWHVVIGLLALATGLLPLLRRFRRSDPVARARVRMIAPRTPKEFAAFYLVCVTAGVAEELAYRGVLFTLLASLVGAWWPAALIGAALFGIVHLFQGWKSAGIAALIGLRDQIVVGLTGTLFVAIVIHTLHDMITGSVVAVRAGAEETAIGAEGTAENTYSGEAAAENIAVAAEFPIRDAVAAENPMRAAGAAENR